LTILAPSPVITVPKSLFILNMVMYLLQQLLSHKEVNGLQEATGVMDRQN
jgi:hypothetical protein